VRLPLHPLLSLMKAAPNSKHYAYNPPNITKPGTNAVTVQLGYSP
jgi:hypothetical protein